MPFELLIFANVAENRTEVEIWNAGGNLVASVFQNADGWQTETWTAGEHSADELAESIARARELLEQYPNRTGEGAPLELHAAAKSLWLMEKEANGEPE